MITFVTSNEGKFMEISHEMRQHGIEIRWEKVEYDEIQGNDTHEISLRSCNDIMEKVTGDFFLEDTGLYCTALNGFPGPYAKYAQHTIGNRGLIRLLEGSERSAYFLTVISLRHGNRVIQFDGKVNGTISENEKGSNGFGFDPVFIPEGQNRTLAEMNLQEKNAFSHRGIAVRKLLRYLQESNLK